MVEISIKGVDEVMKEITDKSKKATQQMSKGLARAAIFIQGEVKMSIAGQRAETRSVDTGRFLNSVGIDTRNDVAVVYSDLDYAKFLEFGTSKFAGRLHFANTKDRNIEKAHEIIKADIEKI